MLFSFIISMFGFMIALRTFTRVRSRNIITQSTLTKIGTIYVITVFVIAMSVSKSYFGLWLTWLFPLVILEGATAILRGHRARKFHENFVHVLSKILLKMKSGKSFRLSFNEVIHESEPHLRAKLTEIKDAVVFSQQIRHDERGCFVVEVTHELRLVDHHPHAAIKRLSSLRSRLKTENDFRHRSGQAARQIRAQSLIMTLIYIALIVFVGARFGFRANANLIFASVALFSIGLIWVFLGGRRYKWKV